jgi:putative ABC transport system permease protein
MNALLERGIHMLVRAYPPRVRHAFGDEIESLVIDTWNEERQARGALGRALLLARLLGDTLFSALAFRLDALRYRRSRSFRGLDMRSLAYDLRFAIRSLLKTPGFTVTTMAVLAIGLAICTAVFTVAEHVLVRPLPYPDPDRLVMLWEARRETPEQHNVVSSGTIADWRAQSQAFTGIGVFNVGTLAIDRDTGRERVPGVVVSTNYFDVLGVQPRLGRNLRPSDAQQGAPRVIVLSDGFWRRHLGGDPGAIGRSISSDTRGYEIVGVMPADFQGPDEHYFGRADFWIPGWGNLEAGRRAGRFLRVIARLRDSVALDQARGELALIAARSAEAHPDTNRNWTATAVPMHDEIVGRVRPVLLILLAAVFVVQLTVCANVAGLLLSRGISKSREYAVRAAIGASARRLAQGIAAEIVALAAGAAIVGLIGAAWLCHALVAIAPDIPRINELALNLPAVGFAAALSMSTAMLAALVPAIGAVRVDPARALNDSSRSTTSASRRRMRRALVVAELAASVTLLVAAGLLTHSFVRLIRTPVGFSSDNVTTARVGLVTDANAGADPSRHAVALGDTLRALPGVEDAGVSTSLPLYGLNNVNFTLNIQTPEGEKAITAFYRAVTPGYMRAVRLEVAAGRLLDDTDNATAPGAVVVNEELARRLGVADPLHAPVQFDFGGRTFDGTIVGVVKGVRHNTPLDEPEPEFYVPFVQHPVLSVLLVAARSGVPLGTSDVRAAVRRVDPRLTVEDIQPMGELFARAVAPQQFNALLLLLLAAIALILATVGLYAVVAQTVTQRIREIGIRLALGARREQVLRLMLGEGLALAFAGVLIGTGLAYSLAATLSRLLYSVTAHDPAVFTLVPALLLLVASIAVWIPARRASAVDPVEALRVD